jgi:DNA-binding transcriptional MerR regulator
VTDLKPKPLLIGRLAKLAGVKPDTVRYYERGGLLPKAERKLSGYRVYDSASVKRLRFIRQAQALGFSLDEIKRILGLHGEGKETCCCVIAIAEATLSDTEEKLRELQAFRDRLKQAVAEWKRSTARRRTCHAEFCDLIENVELRVAPAGPGKLGGRIPRSKGQ